MRVLTGDPETWQPPPSGTVVTIGVYDGLHLGHQRVLARVVAAASAMDSTPAVVTFDRHPLAVVAPERAPKLLTTTEQRTELLGDMGVELVAVLRFDERIRDLSPEEFVELVLRRALGARLVVVGEDFRFGRDRAGDVTTLRSSGDQAGFEVEVVELIGGREAPLSSTVVRRLVEQGKVEEAGRALGRTYELAGVVEEPSPDELVLAVPPGVVTPGEGIYAGVTRGGGVEASTVVEVAADRIGLRRLDRQWPPGAEVRVAFYRRLPNRPAPHS